MLLKVIRQMKENPDLQEAFLHDPDGALAKQGVPAEERTILLGGDQEQLGRAIAREAAQADEEDLAACSEEVKQILVCGDEERIAQYFSKLPQGPASMVSMLMPSPAPGPWIYNDNGRNVEQHITDIEPKQVARGNIARIVCTGAFFEATYAGAELRHSTFNDRIPAFVIQITKPHVKRSEGVLKFDLKGNPRTGVYHLYVRRKAGEDFKQAIGIQFKVT